MNQPDLAKFRARVRAFLHDDVPPLLDGVTGLVPRATAYRRALFDAGFAGLTVPQTYGGQGLSGAYEQVFAEESSLVPDEDGLFMIAVDILLPTLVDMGADGLGARMGPGLLSGAYPACQLFSEPDAGSDLFGLRTRAVPDGEGGWIVSGQKVWTSFAHLAKVGLLIARTDPDVPKQAGLSAFVVDIDAPGVEVRPLRQMSGECEFNEVFLDAVHVPGDRMIGKPGDGLRIITTILAHERASVARSIRSAPRRPLPVRTLVETARRTGRMHDPAVRRDLLEAWMGERTAALMSERITDVVRQGGTPGAATSLGKLHRSANGLRNARIAADLAFSGGAAWDGDEETDALVFRILDTPGMCFGGGTDEIQRNTIGEHLLGLPREPSVERGVPFSKLPSPAAPAQREVKQ